jgi:hypothetical protein
MVKPSILATSTDFSLMDSASAVAISTSDWAPALGTSVREERDAEYLEKGNRMDTSVVRAQHTVLQLVAFKRAA